MDRLRGPRGSGWIVFVVVIAAAAAVAGGLGVAILNNRHKATDAQQTANQAKTALAAACIHRHRLGVNIGRTQQILRHTRGRKFVFAIPRKLIVLGLADDKREFNDDAILDCKETP